MRLLTGVAFASIIAGCSIAGFVVAPNFSVAESAQQATLSADDLQKQIIMHLKSPRQTKSGSYLASRHAQLKHDWSAAGGFIDTVLDSDPENYDLIKRALVLSFGSQDYDYAFSMARKLLDAKKEEPLAASILALKDIKSEDYAKAISLMNSISSSEKSNFVIPVLYAWSRAGLGLADLDELMQHPVHSYQAFLIAEYLGDKQKSQDVIDQLITSKGASLYDFQRIAELQIANKQFDQALKIYAFIDQAQPGLKIVSDRIALLKENTDGDLAAYGKLPQVKILSAAQGASYALEDMAELLFKEYSDESARLFASMALYIDSSSETSRLTLAGITSRNGRHDDAIHYYEGIQSSNWDIYVSAQKEIADLLKEKGQLDEAMRVLEDLVNEGDLDAQLQIGDYYRSQENYREALIAYNTAHKMLRDAEAKESDYWYLFYSKGIALERLGRWDEAETDLRKALSFRPNHPYVLNYLGYSWADQGSFLEDALELIAKAVRLKPDDGFITDSLGWVYYRMGRYDEAVPHLERAVELEPYDPTLNDHLGDAYWQVGRYAEARFQWSRTVNYADSNTDVAVVEEKLKSGLSTKIAKNASRNDSNASVNDTTSYND